MDGEGELLADQPLSHKLIKKWGRLYLFMIVTAPIWYIIRVIISNQLPVADVGLFYSIIWFILLISLYHDLWLTEALQYYLPRYRIQKKYNEYKTILYLTLIVQVITWIGVACIIYFWANRLAVHHFHSPEAVGIIKTLCRYFIWINFLQVFNSVYIAFQDTLYSSLTEFFKVYGILAFTLFFWLSHSLTIENFSMWWISGVGIGLVASSIIFFKKYWKTLKRWTIERSQNLVKTQFKYAFWIFLWANVMTLLGQVDQQMVINFLWPTQAGYYSNYLSLMTMYLVLIAPLLSLLFPLVTELITKNRDKELEMLQNLLYKYFSLVVLTISGILFALWPVIATILFWSKFTYSGHLISYSAPFLVLHVLFSINYGILAGLGKVKDRVKILWRALWVNIILNILLILVFKMWLIGAVIAMIAGWIILFLLSFRIINKHQKIDFDWRFLFNNLVIILWFSLLLYYFQDRIFVLENVYRWKNIVNLMIILLVYYWIIWGVNYKSFVLLWKEIKKLIVLKK
ncbi:MAG: polysaccharide biosynthesis protein CapF [uncultured bacterium (gcode 4)]|uniref:Polysaccharide biosynthesis protein CapF n=1 Tax=uncultured bacterium (gcode 4) TaxID=1234023 RepID=K1X3Y3_9BACT|nr:MAG: polysaccharide biosynthesis protein CapF [uncultured bacterium (gcode 4)]